MKGKSVYELHIGDSDSFSKTMTDADVILFAGVSGDQNPVHIDSVYACDSIFKQRVVHGGLVSALFSTVLGTKLPGCGSIYLRQDSKFLKPVFIGDTVKAVVSVKDINTEKNRVLLETIAYNQHGDIVVTGEATIMPPR